MSTLRADPWVSALAASLLAALVPAGRAAQAAEAITPPAIYPPNSWEGRSAAIVRVLDKLDAHAQTLTIPAGQHGSYKSLGIVVHSCLQHPPGLPPDAAASLTIQDAHATGTPFSGWMFSAEPFIAVFESPVFAVQLVSCDGAGVAPAAPPLLPSPSSAPVAPDPAGTPDAGPDPVYPSGAPDPGVPPDGPAPPQ